MAFTLFLIPPTREELLVNTHKAALLVFLEIPLVGLLCYDAYSLSVGGTWSTASCQDLFFLTVSPFPHLFDAISLSSSVLYTGQTLPSCSVAVQCLAHNGVLDQD